MIIAIPHHVGSPASGWYVKPHISLLYLIRNQYNKVLCYATSPHLRQGRSQQRSSTPIAIFVTPAGFEPAARGLKARCSTN